MVAVNPEKNSSSKELQITGAEWADVVNQA